MRCLGTKVWFIAFTMTPCGACKPFRQLGPSIPFTVIGKGDGYAVAVIGCREEHKLTRVTALDAPSEVWSAPDPLVRMKANWMMGRERPASVSRKGAPSDKVDMSSGQTAQAG